MSPTQGSAAHLAMRPTATNPRDIGRGYRAPAFAARLSTMPTRLDALERLCQHAERKPQRLYDLRKGEGRTLPCERLHNAILDGIQAGYITPEVLADFYGECFAMYRSMMPGATDATYLDTAREKAEAADALMTARMVPTSENREVAVKELSEDVIVSLAHAKALARGTAA
jgi:hypothetical protein